MRSQVKAIRYALGESVISEFDLTVNAALCFVDAEWSFFAKPFVINGVWVGSAKALGKQLLTDGPLDPELLVTLAWRVATALPPA